MTDTLTSSLSTAAGADHASASNGAGRYLTFSLNGEVYALDISQITEILEFKTLTVVPMMPPFLRGVINLRGRVLPVVDLAERFHHGPTNVGRRTSVIVVETRAGDGDDADPTSPPLGVGIIVDAVNKVVHLAEDDIKPPPAFGTEIRIDFISAMAKHEDEFIVVLDIGRVLTLEGFDIASTEALASGPPAQGATGATSVPSAPVTDPETKAIPELA